MALVHGDEVVMMSLHYGGHSVLEHDQASEWKNGDLKIGRMEIRNIWNVSHSQRNCFSSFSIASAHSERLKC